MFHDQSPRAESVRPSLTSAFSHPHGILEILHVLAAVRSVRAKGGGSLFLVELLRLNPPLSITLDALKAAGCAPDAVRRNAVRARPRVRASRSERGVRTGEGRLDLEKTGANFLDPHAREPEPLDCGKRG